MTTFWDERFSATEYAYGTAPNEFLRAQANRLHKGMKALAVADGEGRNGVWLAEQGLDVLSVDASAVGIEKARQLAAERRVNLATLNVDVLDWEWPRDEYDAVVSIFIHFARGNRERIHDAMQAALKPHGLLILVAFTPDQLLYDTGGPCQSELLYTASMVRGDMADMDILELDESVIHLTEGKYHRGTASVLRMSARKRFPHGVPNSRICGIGS